MKKQIINTKADPACISLFDPMYNVPLSEKEKINEMIEAINYLLEKDRNK